MKKSLLLFSLLLLSAVSQAQITFSSTFVPLYTEGKSPTNNDRLGFYFYATLTGLTPGATYRYYATLDSANASPTSNGAGNLLLINTTSGTIRRSTSPSLSLTTGHDSLVAGSSGQYSGWFGVEPTANARFTAGRVVYPKIMLNNGSGGTSVATRVSLVNDPVKVLSFGTSSQDATQGSALYDSLNTPSKNFVALYNDVALPDRPLTIAIVEDDGLQVSPITSYATFYRNNVDSMQGRWGTIIPNYNNDGIRIIEVRDFASGSPLFTLTDSDGIWCGMNTVNPSNGLTAFYLNAYGNISINGFTVPDTMAVTVSDTMTIDSMSNPYTSVSSIDWNFGDGSPVSTGDTVTHTYSTGGMFYVTITITSTGGCVETIMDSVFVTNPLSSGNGIAGAGFSLFPNPARSEVFISTATPSVAEIFTLRGEILLSEKITGNRQAISIAEMTSGVYIVKVTDASGNSFVRKLVIQ